MHRQGYFAVDLESRAGAAVLIPPYPEGQMRKRDFVIRRATVADTPHVVRHREAMFREMGIDAAFEDMSIAADQWLRDAIASMIYRGWVAERGGEVVAGGGLIVIPWPPGPVTMDPRCAFIFNVYTIRNIASRAWRGD